MIQLSGAGKRYGPKILFENTDWLVTPNERAGIVGGNGTGKSSLLKVLAGMEGRFWIDQKSYQWVKVEVTVIRPVWIVGFLAKVETGTQFTLEQTPVAANVWLPAHFMMKTRGRLLMLFKQRSQLDATFYDYRRGDQGTR